ncbi:MAG: hypothetical protein ABL858_06595 [Candidatus Nitrotoga sp.]
MKTLKTSSRIRAGAAALALLGSITWAGTASAAGTASGTSISNLSTLSYSVGGTAQADIGSSAAGNTVGAGTATTFTVDNKVNLSVVEVGATETSVAPGSSNNVTTFTVTNLGNTAQGYTLVAANQGVTTNIFGDPDSFDVTITGVFVETNGTPGYQAGGDTLTAISTLAPDATSVNIYVVATIPAGQANNTDAHITLTATTTTALTTTAVVETAGADTGGVDIVFTDAATTELEFVGVNAARNAQGTARDAYHVTAAVISVAKTSTLLCDPFNFITNPKHIPGAIVRWTIVISNSATATSSATLATVSDTLNANTLHDANLVVPTATVCSSATGTPESLAGRGFQVESNVVGRTLGGQGGTGYMTGSADADGATIVGSAVTIDYSTALPAGGTYVAGELKPGESVTVTFNVTIN